MKDEDFQKIKDVLKEQKILDDRLMEIVAGVGLDALTIQEFRETLHRGKMFSLLTQLYGNEIIQSQNIRSMNFANCLRFFYDHLVEAGFSEDQAVMIVTYRVLPGEEALSGLRTA